MLLEKLSLLKKGAGGEQKTEAIPENIAKYKEELHLPDMSSCIRSWAFVCGACIP